MAYKGGHEKLYRTWAGFKQRCDNPNHELFPKFGGIGIAYYRKWKPFAAFLEWALANGYADGLVLVRKNPLGDYTPSNCTFVTKSETGKYRRDSKEKSCH